MKHLIPSLAQFIIAMMCKFPDYMKKHASILGEIILHLLGSQIRMETVALQMSSALLERIGIFSEEVLNKILFAVFTCMHYYRNNTKNKVIPASITRAIHIFFATFMINFGSDALIQACDKVQPGILFMILRSEGDKIKFCSAPARDRKYVIAAYTNLVMEKTQSFIEDSLKTVISSLIELSRRGTDTAFEAAS